MSDPVTEQLEDAIRAKLAAYDTSGGILTDWIVIAAQQNFDDAGDAVNSVGLLMPNDNFPMYRILGLLDYAATVERAHVAEHATED